MKATASARSTPRDTTPAKPSQALTTITPGISEVTNPDSAAAEFAGAAGYAPPAVVTQHQPPAEVGTSSLALPSEFIGEFNQSDLRLPQLKVVQGSGPLSQKFNQGTLILGDDKVWTAPEPADKPSGDLCIVPVVLEKQYRENLTEEEQKAGGSPRVVNTLAEVNALGYSTQWIGRDKPRFQPSLKMLLIVEEPIGNLCPEAFPLSADGKNYAAALFYAAGSSYNALSQPITTMGAVRRIKPSEHFWVYKYGKVKAGDFTVFRPTLRLGEPVKAGSELAFLIALYSGKKADAVGPVE